MGSTRDRVERFAYEVLFEDRRGKRAMLLRGFLFLLSLVFVRIARTRLWLYERNVFKSQPTGCLVVSIGNLSVGGTGKTPVVEQFARSLQAAGRRVAVLSRGYKSKPEPLLRRLSVKLGLRPAPEPRVVSDGQGGRLPVDLAGDEPFMLANNLPGIPVLVDRDRVKSAVYAVKRWGVDTLVLDDGFQYLPLRQRLDVVLVDAQAALAEDRVLPRGLLREPHDHLKRADVILLTKCAGPGNEELKAFIRQHNHHAEILECQHAPQYLEPILGGERQPLSFLDDLNIAALSGIAVPVSFEGFLKDLGADILAKARFADHHRFTSREVAKFMKRTKEIRAKAIITTEKDAVRFPRLKSEDQLVPVYYLRVEVSRIGSDEPFPDAIRRICAVKTRPQPPVPELNRR
jgi:tetraacyldisaccharide 4'-kinase